MDSTPAGTPEHAEALRSYVDTMRAYRNKAGGYWVASVDPDAASEALTGSIPFAEIRRFAAVSDSASGLVDRFELASWTDALDLLYAYGPECLIRKVRRAEDDDLHGERWPRGKIHDDATVAYCLP